MKLIEILGVRLAWSTLDMKDSEASFLTLKTGGGQGSEDSDLGITSTSKLS